MSGNDTLGIPSSLNVLEAEAEAVPHPRNRMKQLGCVLCAFTSYSTLATVFFRV